MITLRDILHMPGKKAVDIDDVTIILRDKIPSYANRVFGNELHKLHRPFTENDYVWLGLEKIRVLEEAGVTRDDISTMLKRMEHDGIIENIMPQTYFVASLKTLSKPDRIHPIYSIASLKTLFQSNKIYFLTSRGDGFYDDPVGMTNRWLDNVKANYKNFVPPKVIYNHNKNEAMDKYNIKVLFEDGPIYSLDVLENNAKRETPRYVILFNSPFNRLDQTRDRRALSGEMYAQKRSIVEKLDSYEGISMVRVNDWHRVFSNLVK
jgi:hypothetical protein